MAKHNRAFQLMNAAMKHFDLSGSETKVLVAWMSHHIDFHPSVKYLSETTKLHEQNVSRALKGLISKKVLYQDGSNEFNIKKYFITSNLMVYANSTEDMERYSAIEELDAHIERQRRVYFK